MRRQFWMRLIQWLAVLSLPLSLLAGDVAIVTRHWIVRWEYGRPGFPPDPYGLSTAQRMDLALVSVDYIRSDANISLLADLRLPDGSPAFNERELEHMADVQRVLHHILRAGSIAALLVLAGSVILLATDSTGRLLFASLFNGGALTLGLLLAIGAMMIVNWNDFFTTFHRLFFKGDTWLFAYSDTLIRLFPIPFWVDVTTMVVGALAVAALIIMAAARLLDRRLSRSDPGSA